MWIWGSSANIYAGSMNDLKVARKINFVNKSKFIGIYYFVKSFCETKSSVIEICSGWCTYLIHSSFGMTGFLKMNYIYQQWQRAESQALEGHWALRMRFPWASRFDLQYLPATCWQKSNYNQTPSVIAFLFYINTSLNINTPISPITAPLCASPIPTKPSRQTSWLLSNQFISTPETHKYQLNGQLNVPSV